MTDQIKLFLNYSRVCFLETKKALLFVSWGQKRIEFQTGRDGLDSRGGLGVARVGGIGHKVRGIGFYSESSFLCPCCESGCHLENR